MTLRPVDPARDASEIAELHLRCRDSNQSLEPERPDEYFTADGIRERLERSQFDHEDRQIDWVICYDQKIVGKVTISNIVRGVFQSGHLGYSVEPLLRGKGIATLAVRQALDIAFTALGLHRVEAGTLLSNIASQRVLEKTGFIRIGVSPHHLKIAGAWQDHLLFAQTAEMSEPEAGIT